MDSITTCRRIAWDDVDLIAVLDTDLVPGPYEGLVTNSPACSSVPAAEGRVRQ